MRFHQLIHQPTGLHQLRRSAAEDRLPHANLLLAPAGGGGLPAALSLASLLLCEDRQGDAADTPCERCRACRKTGKFIHPDLHFAFPTVGSKTNSDPFLPQWRQALAEAPYLEATDWLQRIGAENKQGNITRDACANIIRKLNLKIFEGRFKVMLIWLPEYLGNEGNRLLKMIEEPPANTVFLLVAERLELILNTIRSRCRITKLGPPNAAEISAALTASGIPAAPATAAARLADGNYNLARALAEDEAVNHGPRFLAWMRACFQGSAAALTAWTDDFAKQGRENQKHFLRYALHFWREFLVLSVSDGQALNVRLPDDELASARKLLPLVDHDQLAEITHIISECTDHVERNANPKILFLDAGIRIHQTLRRSQVSASRPAVAQ